MTLLVGTAMRDFTPPIGSPMGCFPVGPERTLRRAEAVLDPLCARALALDDGATCILLAGVDTTFVDYDSVLRIRALVRERIPAIPAEAVIVAATHTHSSIPPLLFGVEPGNPEEQRLEQQTAEALIAAYGDRQPATLSWGVTTLPINHNRRVLNDQGRSEMVLEYQEGKTTGPVDPDLHALRFTRDDGTLAAILFHYSAHALTMGSSNRAFTADYPGRAIRHLQERYAGCMPVFVNGAAGNLHPRQCLRADTMALEAVGLAVADGVDDALATALTVEAPSLALAADTLNFPHRGDPSLSIQVPISVLRIGPVVFGTIPHELFVEFQLRFRQAIAPAPGTLIGYANAGIGYMPTEQAYDEGGYGVDYVAHDPVEHCRTRMPPGSGEVLLARLIDLAESLHA